MSDSPPLPPIHKLSLATQLRRRTRMRIAIYSTKEEKVPGQLWVSVAQVIEGEADDASVDYVLRFCTALKTATATVGDAEKGTNGISNFSFFFDNCNNVPISDIGRLLEDKNQGPMRQDVKTNLQMFFSK